LFMEGIESYSHKALLKNLTVPFISSLQRHWRMECFECCRAKGLIEDAATPTCSRIRSSRHSSRRKERLVTSWWNTSSSKPWVQHWTSIIVVRQPAQAAFGCFRLDTWLGCDPASRVKSFIFGRWFSVIILILCWLTVGLGPIGYIFYCLFWKQSVHNWLVRV